jgi:hypothetical protein
VTRTVPHTDWLPPTKDFSLLSTSVDRDTDQAGAAIPELIVAETHVAQAVRCEFSLKCNVQYMLLMQ